MQKNGGKENGQQKSKSSKLVQFMMDQRSKTPEKNDIDSQQFLSNKVFKFPQSNSPNKITSFQQQFQEKDQDEGLTKKENKAK